MFDLRPVFRIGGYSLAVLALAMCFPAMVDMVHANPDWLVFAASAAVTLFFALLLILGNHTTETCQLSIRQAFLLTALGWTVIVIAASLPFVFSGLHLSATDAFFEAMSGVTATGATILRGLDAMPPGILLWRALLQWLGGAGFLLLSVLVLPMLNIGGMRIFLLETVGDQLTPRLAPVIRGLMFLYVSFTLVIALLLWGAGMNRFPALLHAMTTISCGGFSSSDGSIGNWRQPSIDWIILAGMFFSGMPFLFYLQLIKRHWHLAFRNAQLRGYLTIFFVSVLVISAWLLLARHVKPLPALRHGAFAVASAMTGTGFSTLDYGTWDGPGRVILFVLIIIGGCAGSTAGGIKIFRFQLLFGNVKLIINKLVHPHIVLIPSYDHKPIHNNISESVLVFLFIYILSFSILSIFLGMLGLDFLSAITTAASTLSNMGPGLTATTGPLVGFALLPDAAKWLLSAGMLLGRLELFIIFVLFIPGFWKT